MNGWCEYMLEDLHDEEQRAKVCGIDVSKLKKDVKAIVLVNDLDVSKKKAMAVYKNGPWPRFFFTNKGKGGIRRKVYLDSVGGRIATNYWPYEETGHTDEAKKELIKIFGQAPFDTPKPTRLIRRVFDLSTDKNSLILDFFAGSGTTLHATMQLNSEDGGHRQCILATNNENGICENVTYERNRRVIQGYTTPKGEEIPGLTHNNLRYYKTKLLPRQQTVKNKRALVEASTDLLCIKNNVYTEQTCFAGRKLKPSCARYFDNGETKMLVIYNELTVDAFAETIYHMDVEGKILIYVFSNTRYAYDDNFEDVLDKVELCALPAAIYDAYRNILPEENQMFEEPLEAEESADGADLAENADEAQSTNTTNEGLLSFDFQNE